LPKLLESHLKITAAKALERKVYRSNNLQNLFDSITVGIKDKLQELDRTNAIV